MSPGDSILNQKHSESRTELRHVQRGEEAISNNFGMLHAITRKEAQAIQSAPVVDSLFYDVSSRSFYGIMSPFTRGSAPVPVPGSEQFSLTVEGIWQGLKVIDGTTDESLFERDRAIKRKSPDYAETIFQYGDTTIDLVEARKRIFQPSLFYMLDNCIPQQLTDNLIRAYKGGLDQYFYDVDDNLDIEDPSSSYSHSAAIVKWLKHKLAVESELNRLVTESGLEGLDYHLPPRTHYFLSKCFDAIENDQSLQSRMFETIEAYLSVSKYRTRVTLDQLFNKTTAFSKYKTRKREILRNLIPEPFDC